MKNNTVITPTTMTASFAGFKNVEPEDLIVFSEEYINHLPYLKNFIKDNMNKNVSIPTLRMNKAGYYSKKFIHGSIVTMDEDSFTISTSEDYYGVRDHYFELLIRFDSVLGIIPLHPEQSKMNPLTVDSSKLKDYFTALSEMKDLLTECLDKENCAITIYYRYTKENPDFYKGDYKVEFNEVLEVNLSNLKYKHLRTTVQLSGQSHYHYVNLDEHDEIDRFIAPDRYLYKVVVNLGTVHKFNFHLDDEES